MTVLSVAIILLALGAVWLALAWRGLVAARDAADATWTAIDVHLKDRQALVPALVAAVQAETAIEAETLARLTAAREDAAVASTPWERADAERRLVAGIGAVVGDRRPPPRPRLRGRLRRPPGPPRRPRRRRQRRPPRLQRRRPPLPRPPRPLPRHAPPPPRRLHRPPLLRARPHPRPRRPDARAGPQRGRRA